MSLLDLPIWDCHVHIFGPRQQFPQHPNSPYEEMIASPEMNLALQKRLGIDRTVIVGCAGAYGDDYSSIVDALVRFPGKFMAVIVSPNSITLSEAKKLHELGVRGVRMFGGRKPPHVPPINEHVATVVNELGWHVEYMNFINGSIEDDVESLLSLGNDIVLDHFGRPVGSEGINQPAFKSVLRMLETGRVWVKLSGPLFSTEQEFPYKEMQKYAKELVAAAPDRIIWGTDWPHISKNGSPAPSTDALLELLDTWVPNASDRRKILQLNPAKLFA